ncbi:MAG: hypothetical protein K0U40_01755 [Betaproteobacteria bacterium]|nr:hypothetical protein [Betaproteobacteria bacterium]
MKNTYQKCIRLFSSEKPRVLIITNESIGKQDAGGVDFVSLSHKFEKKLLCNKSTDALYDLVILDQVCDSPLLCEKLASIWKTREEMFTSLSNRIAPQGSIIIFTQNTVNLHKISLLFYALINTFKRTHSSGTFLRQYTSELKAAKFIKFDYFYIYPDFDSFSHLISIDRQAFQEVISLKYGLPLNIHRHPKYWLRWVLCKIQLDRWLFCCQMIWIRK